MSFAPRGLPYDLQRIVDAELQPGERVVWKGQPITRLAGRGMWPIVLFGVPWTAFALFWTGGAAWMITRTSEGMGPAMLFPLFGLPFIAIGIAMLSSPYWARRMAARSIYVVTDRRAVIFGSGWRGSQTVRSFAPNQLTALQRTQRADGSGDLLFFRNQWRDSDGHQHSSAVGFTAVADVQAVEGVVRALAESRPPAAAHE